MIGDLILATYLATAACVGLAHPRPLPPSVLLLAQPYVPCPLYNGRCAGVYLPRGRRIVVTYVTQGALVHELLHDVLCQAGRCDPHHKGAEWGRCGR